MVKSEEQKADVAAAPAPAPAPAVPQFVDLRLPVIMAGGGRHFNEQQCEHPKHNLQFLPPFIVRVIHDKEKGHYTFINLQSVVMVERMPNRQVTFFFGDGAQKMFRDTVGDILERQWVSMHCQQDGYLGYSGDVPENQLHTKSAVLDETQNTGSTNPYGPGKDPYHSCNMDRPCL